MNVGSTTATTISLSWSVPSGSVVDSYEVMWEGDSIANTTTITDGSTSYTITGLEEDSSYTVTVTATNAAGSIASCPGIIITENRGKYIQQYFAGHFCKQEMYIIGSYVLQLLRLATLQPLWEESLQVF